MEALLCFWRFIFKLIRIIKNNPSFCCVWTVLYSATFFVSAYNDVEALWEEFGYRDNIMVTAEPFGLWVIESEKDISEEFPLSVVGCPVIFTDNQKQQHTF